MDEVIFRRAFLYLRIEILFDYTKIFILVYIFIFSYPILKDFIKGCVGDDLGEKELSINLENEE